jgi:hypothetical protein
MRNLVTGSIDSASWLQNEVYEHIYINPYCAFASNKDNNEECLLAHVLILKALCHET